MRKRSALILLIAAAMVSFKRPAMAQPAAPAEAPAAAKAGDVKPEEVVREAADFLGRLPAFSCNVEKVVEVKSNIQNSSNVTKLTLRLERPNRLAMIVEEGVHGITIVSDGKQIVQHLPIMQQSAEGQAPATFEEMLAVGTTLPPTFLGPVGDILGDNGHSIFKKLMRGVTEAKYVGEEKVGDVMCRHLKLIREDMDWDMWIEAGKQPLIRKIVPDLAKQLAAAGQQLGDAKVEYTITFSDWNVTPKFTDADFKYSPPPPPMEPLHPLLGQPAPAFTTTDLEEKPIDLAKHLGKDVVMLDFWATWCGPCVKALPAVDGVAKKFKDKGLVFYAVNCGEDIETIKGFLAQAQLNPTVALDTQDAIGPLYKVEGIPQTVLIGKDGKVQVVHVGSSPDLDKTLTKNVEDLLAGKDLAKEEQAKWDEEQKKRKASGEAKPTAGEEAPADKGAENAPGAK